MVRSGRLGKEPLVLRIDAAKYGRAPIRSKPPPQIYSLTDPAHPEVVFDDDEAYAYVYVYVYVHVSLSYLCVAVFTEVQHIKDTRAQCSGPLCACRPQACC